MIELGYLSRDGIKYFYDEELSNFWGVAPDGYTAIVTDRRTIKKLETRYYNMAF
jgi:hypothetical protein